MKFRKTLSLLLSVLMVAGSATVAASAATVNEPVGAYSNQNYLETYADAAYNESGLGATYTKSATTFKVWSPEASAVKVRLYKTGSDAESGAGQLGDHAMTKNSTTGVWSVTLQGDYKNTYYTYLVTVNGTTNETQDVYSKATGVNGARSMVVDLDSTDPEGWGERQARAPRQRSAGCCLGSPCARLFNFRNLGRKRREQGTLSRFCRGRHNHQRSGQRFLLR